MALCKSKIVFTKRTIKYTERFKKGWFCDLGFCRDIKKKLNEYNMNKHFKI